MADIDRDWIKKQIGKIISAEESVLKTEKDHRDSIDVMNVPELYTRLIREDEAHLADLKRIGARYGWEEGGGMMESVGSIAGGAKSAVEGLVAADPFQAVADDIVAKSASLNSGRTWTRIFSAIGDDVSAGIMQRATLEDEDHVNLMLDTCVNIGIMEARGQRAKAA